MIKKFRQKIRTEGRRSDYPQERCPWPPAGPASAAEAVADKQAVGRQAAEAGADMTAAGIRSRDLPQELKVQPDCRPSFLAAADCRP